MFKVFFNCLFILQYITSLVTYSSDKEETERDPNSATETSTAAQEGIES